MLLHSLALQVVAEGVTAAAQLKFLQAEYCDAIQGYLMSAAIPAVAFAGLLRLPLSPIAYELALLRRQAG